MGNVGKAVKAKSVRTALASDIAGSLKGQPLHLPIPVHPTKTLGRMRAVAILHLATTFLKVQLQGLLQRVEHRHTRHSDFGHIHAE